MYTTIKLSYPADILDRYNAYIKAGDAEKALLMLCEVTQMSTDELDLLRSLPSWQARVLAAHTIPREVLSIKAYSHDPRRFQNLETPTRFLLGSETSPLYKAATQTLHVSLPHSRIEVLPGQQHDAVVTAPELVLREAVSFFLGNS